MFPIFGKLYGKNNTDIGEIDNNSRQIVGASVHP
jgi:hypothetical protein